MSDMPSKGRSRIPLKQQVITAVTELRVRLKQSKSDLVDLGPLATRMPMLRSLSATQALVHLVSHPEKDWKFTTSQMRGIIKAAHIASQCVPELLLMRRIGLPRRAE